ncbi:Emp65 [Kluyveromyces lactis]|nr:Emp65 [Kluyveromyces lactis]
MSSQDSEAHVKRRRARSEESSSDAGRRVSFEQEVNTVSSTIKNFIYQEILPQTAKVFEEEPCDQSEKSVEYDLEQIANILRVPFQVEQFFVFAILTCLNCFLYYFTIIPLRVFHVLVVKRDGPKRIRQELLTTAMILGPCSILNVLDTSRIYHKIKGQNAIKLYMIFQVLEMTEKLLSSVGLDLYSIIMLKKSAKHKTEMVMLYIACCLCLSFHALIYIYQILAMNVAVNSYSNSLWTLLLSMQFSELKSAVFKRIDKEGLFQLTMADVVERFQLIVFLTVIAVRNFIVARKSLHDVLPHSWNVHSTQSLIVGIFIGPIVTVIGSELIVDWIKHAYIIKFNRIRAHIYERYLQILSKDNLSNSIQFQKRLGLPFPPLIVAFLVLVWPAIRQTIKNNIIWSAVLIIFGFLWALLTKLTLQAILSRWTLHIQNKQASLHPDHLYINGLLSAGRGMMDEDARKMIHSSQTRTNSSTITPPGSPKLGAFEKKASIPPSLNEQRTKRDLKHPKSLESVERYKMVSKRIW